MLCNLGAANRRECNEFRHQEMKKLNSHLIYL